MPDTRSGGSYENVSRVGEEIIRDEQSEAIIDSASEVKYRRAVMPEAIQSLRDEMGECSFKTGHVLRIEVDIPRIYCIHCPAEWFNEGF